MPECQCASHLQELQNQFDRSGSTSRRLLTRSRFELTENYDYSNDVNTFNLNSTALKIKDKSRDLVASKERQLTQLGLLPGQLNNLVKLANV